MPEYPDITVYIEALDERLQGQELLSATLNSPFLLRSVEPGLDEFIGRRVTDFRRLGKRIALGFDDDYWLVVHLMIAGRWHWKPPDKKVPAKTSLLVLGFDCGTLYLTEAGKKKRASLHLLKGAQALAAMEPGGINVLDCSLGDFAERLRSASHTLKRSLTDPRLFSGIGNAYSDEILHRAGLSPIAMSLKLDDAEVERLYGAIQVVLVEWTERLRRERGDGFPEKVTAFHDEMAVHGRFGKPCPACGTSVQRIRYATNETNYCPTCQTGGRVLADRALSRLLKKDWPRSVEELEKLRR